MGSSCSRVTAFFYRIVSWLFTRNGGEIHYPGRSVYQSKDSGPLGNGAVIDIRDYVFASSVVGKVCTVFREETPQWNVAVVKVVDPP